MTSSKTNRLDEISKRHLSTSSLQRLLRLLMLSEHRWPTGCWGTTCTWRQVCEQPRSRKLPTMQRPRSYLLPCKSSRLRYPKPRPLCPGLRHRYPRPQCMHIHHWHRCPLHRSRLRYPRPRPLCPGLRHRHPRPQCLHIHHWHRCPLHRWHHQLHRRSHLARLKKEPGIKLSGSST